MMPPANQDVQNLAREYPEWSSWLAVIDRVIREIADPVWEGWVPERPQDRYGLVPFLAGTTVSAEPGKLRRWRQQLVQAAYQSGAPNMSSLKPAQKNNLDSAVLFESALCEDTPRLRQIAGELGIEPDTFQAVTGLLPVPFLHACNRRWTAARPPGWTAGYCPTCGAWPAFAEVRGIERDRYLRCGRCGSEWQSHALSCPYCGNTDHDALASLLPERSAAARAVDTCKRCLGYVKTVTTLQGSPPAKVILDDLASVDLDIAALEQGYKRPAGPGYALDSRVAVRSGPGERFFRWHT